MSKFDSAKFYDCCEPEELRHQSPKEALWEYIDLWHDPDDPLRDTISEKAPIKVTGYVPEEGPTDDWIKARIDCALESLDEAYSDEWAPPDDPPWHPDEAAKLRDKIFPLVKEFLAKAPVWQCKEIAERIYSVDELLEIFKDDLDEDTAA